MEMYTDDDGMVVIRGRLPQEIEALLEGTEGTLEAAMDALKEKQKSEMGNDRVESDGELKFHDSAEAYRHPRREAAFSDDSAEACQGSGPFGLDASAESCRRLACDAPQVTVSQDADGNVLHLGRKARTVSTPLWRALMSRDRTCRFPGCARTRHLQAYHIEHWARGGETNPTDH